jgi:hypothetical protein
MIPAPGTMNDGMFPLRVSQYRFRKLLFVPQFHIVGLTNLAPCSSPSNWTSLSARPDARAVFSMSRQDSTHNIMHASDINDVPQLSMLSCLLDGKSIRELLGMARGALNLKRTFRHLHEHIKILEKD